MDGGGKTIGEYAFIERLFSKFFLIGCRACQRSPFESREKLDEMQCFTDSRIQTRSEIMVWTNQRDARAARTPDHRMSCPQQAIGGSANFRSSCSSVSKWRLASPKTEFSSVKSQIERLHLR